jgi:Uma2 family endonuclease
MHHAQPTGISVEEYLDAELRSQERHEYVAGEVYAMTGASERHNLITGNILATLHGKLRGGPCRVFASDMKLRVEAVNAFYYPDILVVCDQSDREQNFKQRPCLIIEVLSPSTAGTDRREKLHAYRTLASLREYVLVDQKQRAVWVYQRAGDAWLLDKLDTGDLLRLESLDVTLSLDEIYDNVELPDARDIREEELHYMLG